MRMPPTTATRRTWDPTSMGYSPKDVRASARMPRPCEFNYRLATDDDVRFKLGIAARVAGVPGRLVCDCLVGRPYQALSRQHPVAAAHLQLRARRLRLELDLLWCRRHREAGWAALHRGLLRTVVAARLRHPLL